MRSGVFRPPAMAALSFEKYFRGPIVELLQCQPTSPEIKVAAKRVCIIGGGIAGVGLWWTLAQPDQPGA